jgi:catechol 2,3-dioxygenase-like lactoylglutathione lyase family enzyme
MADHATPNLPSRDYANTIKFYSKLGFETSWHDENWLIIERGGLCLEFFRYPDLDPSQSSFSCCLRLDDLSQFYADCLSAGIEDKRQGWPRIHPPKLEHSGMTIAYLVDPDGTLLRLVQNPESA